MRKEYIEKPRKPISFDSGALNSFEKIYQVQKYDQVINKPEFSVSSFHLGFRYLKSNRVKIQKIFLVVILIMVFNYIFDSHLIIKGLIPSDFIIPVLSAPPIYIEVGFNETSFLINPILFIVGLASISPISCYLSSNAQIKNLIGKSGSSLILGLILLIILILSWVLIYIVIYLFIFLLMTNLNSESYPYYDPIGFWMSSLMLLIFGIEMLFFQRIWALLVYRGLNPDDSLRHQISLIRKKASRGQFGFIALLFIHEIFQGILNMIFRPPVLFLNEEYGFIERILFPPLHPISFLVLISFEIGFFILLIIYQFVQFSKGGFLIPFEDLPKNTPTDDT
jgi:hypothetical protein